jgi:hypothetical protein
MEKESITIEIKQEVSITLLWIVAGVVVVSATFFLTPQTTELWPAINATGIAAAVYLVALLGYVLRKPLAMRQRLLVGIIGIAVIGCTAFTWMKRQEQAQWQANQLMKIRAVIGRGIKTYEMAPLLLKTLDAYHRQGVRKSNTLADELKKQCPGAEVGANLHKPQGEWDELTVIVESLEPNRIVLVSQETYVKGRDPGFKNYDGKTGMLQEKFILTERGLTHVSEN